ncbi:MAG TPA: hypothetical protein DHV48_10400 [Prolixibacteraceae bacterium]|nr:hypothetical protein [Prolixibacteraceae bacterium]
MKKHFYFFIMLLMAVFNIYNYINPDCPVKEEVNDELLNRINLDSESYLDLLTSYTLKPNFPIIKTINGDTINNLETNVSCIYFVFSNHDCSKCAENHLYELLELDKDSNKIKINIITTQDNSRFVELFSRSNASENISYGYSLSSPDLLPMHYFIAFSNGQISNPFYPEKGDISFTKKYLKKAINTIHEHEKKHKMNNNTNKRYYRPFFYQNDKQVFVNNN